MPKKNRKMWIIQRLKDTVARFPDEFTALDIEAKFNTGAGFGTLSPREISGLLRRQGIATKVEGRKRNRRQIWRRK